MATHSNILAWEIPWSTVHGVTKGRTLLSDYAWAHVRTRTRTHTHTHSYRTFNCFFYWPFGISIWKHQHHESFWSFLTLLSTSSFATQLLLQFQSSFTHKWEAWTNCTGLLTLNDIFLFWSTMCSVMFVNLCDHITTTVQTSVILPSNTQLIIIQKPMEQKPSFAVSFLMKKYFFKKSTSLVVSKKNRELFSQIIHSVIHPSCYWVACQMADTGLMRFKIFK